MQKYYQYFNFCYESQNKNYLMKIIKTANFNFTVCFLSFYLCSFNIPIENRNSENQVALASHQHNLLPC